MIETLGFEFYSFYETWKLLYTKIDNNDINKYSIPHIVNGAFACELALKYILQSEGIKYHKTHLLHELLDLLPKEKNKAIFDNLKNIYPIISDEELELSIRKISNAFDDFRYSFEHSVIIDPIFSYNFFSAVFEQAHLYPIYDIVRCNVDDSKYPYIEKLEQKNTIDTLKRLNSKEKRG